MLFNRIAELASTALYKVCKPNRSKLSKSMQYILHERKGNGMRFGKTVSYQQCNNAPLKVKYQTWAWNFFLHAKQYLIPKSLSYQQHITSRRFKHNCIAIFLDKSLQTWDKTTRKKPWQCLRHDDYRKSQNRQAGDYSLIKVDDVKHTKKWSDSMGSAMSSKD